VLRCRGPSTAGNRLPRQRAGIASVQLRHLLARALLYTFARRRREQRRAPLLHRGVPLWQLGNATLRRRRRPDGHSVGSFATLSKVLNLIPLGPGRSYLRSTAANARDVPRSGSFPAWTSTAHGGAVRVRVSNEPEYFCSRCDIEWALRRGPCEWCHLGDTLDELLDGGVDLSSVPTRLLSAARPDSIIIWLYRPHARALLHGFTSGTIPLTHQAVDEVPHRVAGDHLRALFVVVGLLPGRDERLARFDR
jgi:hypothetical protein